MMILRSINQTDLLQSPAPSQHFFVAGDPARGGTLFAHRFMRLPPELIPTTSEPFMETFLRGAEWDGMPRLGANKKDMI